MSDRPMADYGDPVCPEPGCVLRDGHPPPCEIYNLDPDIDPDTWEAARRGPDILGQAHHHLPDTEETT